MGFLRDRNLPLSQLYLLKCFDVFVCVLVRGSVVCVSNIAFSNKVSNIWFHQVLDIHAYEARQKDYAFKGHRHFYFMTLNGSEVWIYPL